MNGAIAFVGYSTGSKSLSSKAIEEMAGYECGEIQRLTGIESRFVLSEAQTDLDLGVEAFSRLRPDLADQIKNSRSILVSAISTAEFAFPSFSSRLQDSLGWSSSDILSFDLNAACAGFQHAVSVGSAVFEREVEYTFLIIIGVSAISRYVDWEKPGASLYFGDGAGVIVIKRSETPLFLSHASQTYSKQVMSVVLPKDSRVQINGLEVWKQVVTYLPRVIRECLVKAEVQLSDVNWFVFHQANKNLIKFAAHKLAIPDNRVLICIEQIGNTAEASIPSALAINQDQFSEGDLILLAGVGAGYHAGASLVRWTAS